LRNSSSKGRPTSARPSRAPCSRDLLPGQLEHVAVLDQHLARRDDRTGAGIAQQRGADGGLAGAGLADEPDDLTGPQHQVDVVDDVDGPPGQGDP
jgi:hypothetical protein